VIATFLNHICLRAGEAAFLGPGTVHAYLGGVAIEVMSTSDNVLRAGLTPKLVDVDEFLAVARCEPGEPDVLLPDGRGALPERASEFSIRRYAGSPFDVVGPAIVVATVGSIAVGDRILTPGRGAFVPDGAAVTLRGSGDAYVARPGSA
jgi:mannose-6-phosphate isomerase